DGVVYRQPVGEQALLLEPVQVDFTEILDVLPTFGAGDDGTDRQEQDIEQGIADFGGLTRVFQLTEILRKCIKAHHGSPKKGVSDHNTICGSNRTKCAKNVRDLTL